MPSFPDSVFAPPNRSNGQTADASHMNGVQDEIVAIEGGYRNATAPLNSSNSTVANLSVTGASTITGNLTVNGTLTANLARIPSAKVTHTAAMRVASSQTWVGMDWDTETYDSTAMHSTSVNSSRIALTSSGLWMVGAHVAVGGNVFLDIETRIMLNDASALSAIQVGAINSDVFTASVTATYLATSTSDYVTVQSQSHKSTGSMSTNSTLAAVAFWAHRVSQ